MPTFPLRRVTGGATIRGHKIPRGQQQYQIVLLLPHQDGTNEVRKCSHSTWPLDNFWTAFLWVYSAGLAFQSFQGPGVDIRIKGTEANF